MKKRIFSVILVVLMLCSGAVMSFAADPEVKYNSVYNAETGLVSVSIYVTDAIGLEAADFRLSYDTDKYEYKEHETADLGGDCMVVAGCSAKTEGLATCSVIFTESCEASVLDSDGNLNIVTFIFQPKTEEYDINEFCFWASSFDMDGKNVAASIPVYGDTSLMEEKTDSIIVPSTLSNMVVEKGPSSAKGTKWYVYVIAVVLALSAIGGISFIAIKNGNHEEKSEEVSSEEKTNSDN